MKILVSDFLATCQYITLCTDCRKHRNEEGFSVGNLVSRNIALKIRRKCLRKL